MKKICIYPEIKKDNKYVENYVNSLKTYEVIEFKKMIKFPLKFFKVSIFHFNWIENIKMKNKIMQYVEFFLKLKLIKLIKLSNKKVVWTFHNKEAHNGNSYSKKIIEYMIKESDNILIHCKESYKYLNILTEKEKVKKVRYIPHGNYIDSYGSEGIDKRKEFNIPNDKIVYMFIGQVKEYKNIEILIESYIESEINNSILLICGKATEEYKNKLKNEYGHYNNIIFNLKFINDEEMVDYINCADIFVTPYDIKSSLNSGSIIMYFSYCKTVISTRIGTLKDIDEDFYYSYEYNNEKDHKMNLINIFQKTFSEYMKNEDIFKIKGKRAYEYVDKYYSWDKLSSDIESIYKGE